MVQFDGEVEFVGDSLSYSKDFSSAFLPLQKLAPKILLPSFSCILQWASKLLCYTAKNITLIF